MEFAIVNLGDNLPHPETGVVPSDAEKHRQLIEQAVQAEALGYDAFLLGEHHFNYFIISSPFVVLAAIAERTSRMRLGTGVTLLPTRDPVLVAEEVATLDVLSGGRAEVGVGRGIHQGIYEVMGRSADNATELLDEGVDLLFRLLNEEEVTWSGKWRTALDAITIRPRPVQPQIPLWSGSTSAIDQCARLGLPCMWVATVYPFEKLAPLADKYRESWVAAGNDEDDFQLGIGVHTHIGATSQQARDRFRPHFAHYFECSAGIEKSQLKRAVVPTARDLTLFDDVPFVGSAQEIIDRIGAARDLLGLTRMTLAIDLGGLEYEAVVDQQCQIAEQVLPAFASTTGATSLGRDT
jgi:alkanesulfonate monooxygenase SsuD/methylene tetrahydromethanopterin reductase-like flavin-dependent oxidoreductase (luciferase family)